MGVTDRPCPIDAGSGDDTVNVATDAPANLGHLSAINGPLTINGQGGTNRLNVSDLGGNGDAAGVLSGTQITGLGNAGPISYAAIAELTLNLSAAADTLTVTGTHGGLTRINGNGGADSVQVRATAAGSMTNINGGADADTVTVGSATNTLDTILGTVAFGGGEPGTPTGDTLVVSDAGNAASGEYRLTALCIQKLVDGALVATVGYSSVESLLLETGSAADQTNVTAGAGMRTTVSAGAGADAIQLTATGAAANVQLNGQGGNDTFAIRSTGLLSTTTVSAGGGEDTIYVSSDAGTNLGNVNGIVGALTINGDADTDALNVSDLGGAADLAAVLSATQITGLGNAGAITYAVDVLNLQLSKGADVLTVTNTHAGSTTIAGNDGPDIFTVRATGGATAIDAGSGDDTVNVAPGTLFTPGSLEAISGPLTINGHGGTNRLNVSDLSGSGDAAGVLSGTQITGLGNAGAISYAAIAELTLNLSAAADTLTVTGTHGGLTRINGNGGADSVQVRATAAGSMTNINGGNDPDTVTVGSVMNTLDTILGMVAFGGGAPDSPPGDTLVINDAGSAPGADYRVNDVAVQKFVDGVLVTTIGYSGVETFLLNTPTGLTQASGAGAAPQTATAVSSSRPQTSAVASAVVSAVASGGSAPTAGAGQAAEDFDALLDLLAGEGADRDVANTDWALRML